MCGIAGVVDEGEPALARATVEKMLDRLRHRGPELSSAATIDAATFGACRLGFVDTAAPNQPYVSPDRTILIVFNGEIYNFRELWGELPTPIQRRYPLGELSVLAALYTLYGPSQMAAALNGMFAIAIRDARLGQTYLIRDRFGEKPLYYVHGARPKDVGFASELSALRVHPRVGADIDPRVAAAYLTLNVVPAPTAILAPARKVRPGCIVRVGHDGVTEVPYWTVSLPTPRVAVTTRDLTAALRRAVRLRMPSGTPFGVFLSGGIDSSVIAALAASEAPEPIRTYSIGFPEARSFDESTRSADVARAVGAIHSPIPLGLRELAEACQHWLGKADEPIADSSFVPTLLMAEVARRDVKAVLTGDGADELAMGSSFFYAIDTLFRVARVVPPSAVGRLLEVVGRAKPSERNLDFRYVASALAHASVVRPEEQCYAFAAAFRPAEWRSVLTDEAQLAVRGLDVWREVNDVVRRSRNATHLERVQLSMVTHFLRDLVLSKLDRATMFASLEARSPFLDADVALALLGMPEAQKLRGATTKHAVREVAQLVLNRRLPRKHPFRVPISALLRGHLREWAFEMLGSDSLRADGIFRPAAVENLLNEHVSGARDHHRALWTLLCFQAWANEGRSFSPPPWASNC